MSGQKDPALWVALATVVIIVMLLIGFACYDVGLNTAASAICKRGTYTYGKWDYERNFPTCVNEIKIGLEGPDSGIR